MSDNILEIFATSYMWLLEHMFLINVVFSFLIIFFQRKNPTTVWAWLLLLYFIPILGFLLYMILGQNFRKERMFKMKEIEGEIKYAVRRQEESIYRKKLRLRDPELERFKSLILYNLNEGEAVLTDNNDIRIYTDGREKFNALLNEMDHARNYIHIQYYIIKNDELFDSMIPILLDKVRNGVEVRILYDGMGGRFMPKRKWKMLKEAGIGIASFFPPVLGRLNFRVNYRNHRKIVVIDGRVGYVGGFNIGREYISKDPKFGYWRDTHLKIYGEAVIGLQLRFAQDWNYAAGENLFKDMRYFNEADGMPEPTSIDSMVGIQIISSGPDTQTRQIRDNYLELFHKARHHIYIQTPYFVPDDAVLSAIQIAARSGVDVRLMIPCKPDHPFVYWATYSYVGDLLRAGAKCYTYENGFLHAKGVSVDGFVSCYGTANMDIRSFELNFEVNAVIYDEETTERLEEAFLSDLAFCREITPEDYEARGLIIRFKEQCSRLLSPLL